MEDYNATTRNGHQLLDFYDPETNTRLDTKQFWLDEELIERAISLSHNATSHARISSRVRFLFVTVVSMTLFLVFQVQK